MIKFLKITVDVIFIIIIILLSFYFILRFTGKSAIYKVKTGSMEDGIHVNDYILVYKTNTYNVGDVVTYKEGNDYVTHRIVRKIDNKVITKGDANNVEDEEIPLSNITGKVIYIGGILNIIFNFKYALIALMLAIYLITCYFDDGKKEKE